MQIMQARISQIARPSKLYYCVSLLLLLLLSACALKNQQQKNAGIRGDSLTVWIDGKETERVTAEQALPLNIFTQSTVSEFWQIKDRISAQPKISYALESENVGVVTEAMLTVQQLSANPKVLPRPFYTNLSRPSAQFLPKTKVLVKDIQTAESDDYLDRFPPGQYVFSIYVYGSKGWDKQNILVEIL